jgi:hypothetical protein
LTIPARSCLKIVQKLTNKLDDPEFIEIHKRAPQDFTRQRTLTFKHLVLFLLNQPQSALQTELDQFFHVLQQAPFESRQVTAQAFSKARHKLLPETFQSLNQALQKQLEQFDLHPTWHGLRLLAIDGSDCHLPLEEAQARFFGTHQALPVARLSTLYDVLSAQTLHGLAITQVVDERSCAELHLDHAPAHSLILFDRGYPAHWLFAALAQRGQHYLMRLPRNYNRSVQAFAESDRTEQVIISRANHGRARALCQAAELEPTTAIPLRLIRVPLSTGDTEILATSLLDTEQFPTAVFADLYHLRWGIETDYRRLKQSLNLENFSGRSVTAVKQDFQARLLSKTQVMKMARLQQPLIDHACRNRKRRWQANFTQGLSRLKNTLVALALRPCGEAWGRLLALIRQGLVAVRPGRHFPRKRRRHATQGCEGYKPAR